MSELTMRQSFRGLRHRAKMRIAHRLGFCYPEQSGPEPDRVWCHWCGMRGSKPADVRDPAVAKRIEASMQAAVDEYRASEQRCERYHRMTVDKAAEVPTTTEETTNAG